MNMKENMFSRLKNKLSGKDTSTEFIEDDADYVEVDGTEKGTKNKVIVRPFVIREFADIKYVLDALREGYTIALVNIKPIKDKDIIELKRAINKLKKTCDAMEGDIAGFGEDWIVATPPFAQVHRSEGLPVQENKNPFRE